MLLLCTIIWGAAFSFQTMAVSYIQPFTLISIRFLLAAVVLTPLVFIYVKKNKTQVNYKVSLIGGVVTGAFLAFASVFQQFGIEQTSTGKAGFLTAMYIIFVPLVSVILFKKKMSLWQIIGVVVTVAGAAFLSLDNNFSVNIGDILCLVGAFLYALQIISVEKFTNKTNSLVLAVISFYACGLISLIFSLFFETVSLNNLTNAIIPILYLGIGSSAIAYTLQFIGQKRISGIPASLIMSLEAVFSVVFAWVILQEILAPKEIIGAILMLLGVLVVQIFDN